MPNQRQRFHEHVLKLLIAPAVIIEKKFQKANRFYSGFILVLILRKIGYNQTRLCAASAQHRQHFD